MKESAPNTLQIPETARKPAKRGRPSRADKGEYWAARVESYLCGKAGKHKPRRYVELLDALFEAALGGDTAAAKLLMDRGMGPVPSGSATGVRVSQGADGDNVIEVVYRDI